MSEFSFLAVVFAILFAVGSCLPLEMLAPPADPSHRSLRSLTAHRVCSGAEAGKRASYIGTMGTDTIKMTWKGSQLLTCEYLHGIH